MGHEISKEREKEKGVEDRDKQTDKRGRRDKKNKGVGPTKIKHCIIQFSKSLLNTRASFLLKSQLSYQQICIKPL